MTTFVIAIAIYFLLSTGASLGFAAAGYTYTRTTKHHLANAFTGAVLATGALWVWLS